MGGSYAGIYVKVLDLVLSKGDRVGLSVLMGLAARADKYGKTDIGVERLSKNISLDAVSVYAKLAQFERIGWIQIRPLAIERMSNTRFAIQLSPDVLLVRNEVRDKVCEWWSDPYEFHFDENRNIQDRNVMKQDQPIGLTNGQTNRQTNNEPMEKTNKETTPVGQDLAISALSNDDIADFSRSAAEYEANTTGTNNAARPPAPAGNSLAEPNRSEKGSSPIIQVLNSSDLATRVKAAAPDLEMERIRGFIANEGAAAVQWTLDKLLTKKDTRDPAAYFVWAVRNAPGARPASQSIDYDYSESPF